MKRCQKIWAGRSPPPPHLSKIQKNSSLFREFNLFLLLPQALTKDKPLTILIPQCISITCFGLRPDHMVFYRQLNEKSYHIRSSSEDNFCFLSQSSLLSFTKGGKRLKTWTPQGLFSFLFSPPSLPSPPSSSKPLLAESRTPPSPSPCLLPEYQEVLSQLTRIYYDLVSHGVGAWS